jgi:hypothetical protein
LKTLGAAAEAILIGETAIMDDEAICCQQTDRRTASRAECHDGLCHQDPGRRKRRASLAGITPAISR